MIIKKKLKNVTKEEFIGWKRKNCIDIHNYDCNKCVFKAYNCSYFSEGVWVKNKSLCSRKFLNQKIEIGGILTKNEKEYLSAVIKPFRERIKSITKVAYADYEFIRIELKYSEELGCFDFISLPSSKPNTMYKEMKAKKGYTLKELDL